MNTIDTIMMIVQLSVLGLIVVVYTTFIVLARYYNSDLARLVLGLLSWTVVDNKKFFCYTQFPVPAILYLIGMPKTALVYVTFIGFYAVIVTAGRPYARIFTDDDLESLS